MGEQGFFAHTPVGDGPWHDLVLHLQQTADKAQANAAKFGAGELARLAGLWHDIGKFNPEFQEYLRRCEAAERDGEEAPAKSVPHAVYGALLAWDSMDLLAPVIYGHHAGLPNRSRLQGMMSEEQEVLRETYARLLPSAREHVAGLDYEGGVSRLVLDVSGGVFQAELFLRMVFSALVDADFLDTEEHFEPGTSGLRGVEHSPADLWPVLERDQARIMSKAEPTPVNSVRREVYEACLRAADAPQGVFRLSVPTGGGKTRSGLAFALRHAMAHGLDRVIFAVPYTSIIEQTAGEYRRIFACFGEGVVLEHHSGVRDERPLHRGGDPEEAERLHEARMRARLGTQNWDAPLVVTTTVQLFESLFANRTSRCRKLHNVARSVIVLDEVQTLPLKLLDPTMSVLKELVRRYGVSVVLCTATQPAFETDSPYLQGFPTGSVKDIVPRERASGHFQTLKRVRYEKPTEDWSWPETARRLKEAAPDGRAMAVLNSRRDALALLAALADDSALHLSTLLCGANRRDVLQEVRRRLHEKEPCLLVATQVVEAGVDLDFPVVFRAVGPLDRIVQAAGRCNREGRLDWGRVVIFRPEEGGGPRGEYASARAQTEMMLRCDGFDLYDPGVFREYFEMMYQLVDTDGEKVQEARESLDYPEVAARYRLIRDDTVPVIVDYEEKDTRRERERRRLFERIRREEMLRPGDHRRLQPYTVGLFEKDFEEKKWAMLEVAKDVWMWTGEYDPVRGIVDVGDDPADLIW